jgi:hypothetical protein
MEMWRRRREAASAGLSAALYSVYSGLYSEAVVSSVASAVALVEVGHLREAVQYVQKAAEALYDTAKEVLEQVKVAVQRLVELFVEAVTRMLAWVDEHKAYLFLMAAAAAGVVVLSAAWICGVLWSLRSWRMPLLRCLWLGWWMLAGGRLRGLGRWARGTRGGRTKTSLTRSSTPL